MSDTTSDPPVARPPRPEPARASRQRRAARDLRAYAADRNDAQARERVVRAYLPLAHAVARRFDRGGSVPLDDLHQVAAVGLIKALNRYDPDHGAAFTSFAVPTIQGEIRRYFRDHTWTVRPPRDLQELVVRVERERGNLTERLGRSPTATELAERIGCSTEDIVDAAVAAGARRGDSLDRPVGRGEDDAELLGERIGADDPGFATAEAGAALEPLLATLAPRERQVLLLRFHDDLTQAEIGARVGCSQMQVSRIIRAALARLATAAEPAPDANERLTAWAAGARRQNETPARRPTTGGIVRQPPEPTR